MRNQGIAGRQVFAAFSLALCFIVALICAAVFLYLIFLDTALYLANEILEGGYREVEIWISQAIVAGYGINCVAMFAASIGLLLRRRWGQILGLICLPLLLLISGLMSIYSLQYLWARTSLLDAMRIETLLFLIPIVMMLYSIWGLVQILTTKTNEFRA